MHFHYMEISTSDFLITPVFHMIKVHANNLRKVQLWLDWPNLCKWM